MVSWRARGKFPVLIVQETDYPVMESAHVALWHGSVAAVLGAVGWIAGPRLLWRD